jgi:DNA-binding NtrC family response regulator
MTRILVVDDDPSCRSLLADILAEGGFEVALAADGAAAWRILESGPVDLVLTDQRMPRLGGFDLLRKVRSLAVPPPVVVLTAFGSIPEAVEAVRLGAADYMTKPLPSPAALLVVVRRLLAQVAGDDEFVTETPAVREMLALVDRVAPKDVSVLVTGESGTGKELIARRVHARSGRSASPFVAVNCAAIPGTLAESELFGHEKGAFTGADQLRKGRFEEADQGTLFLDEIGELPVELQAKLLRVLEEKRVRRLGGQREIPADVRIVAATNRDLTRAVEEGRFRKDLFFRLAVVTIALSPLRDRREDIPPLVRFLVARLAAHHALPTPTIEESASIALVRHDWPGNVRELRNVLERALVVRGGEPIREIDLGLPRPGSMEPPDSSEAPGVPLVREEWERGALLRALEQSGGNRERAAELLGVSVRTLYYRLRRFGIR